MLLSLSTETFPKYMKSTLCRDALEATLNYGAHVKFVNKWLEKLEAESKPAAETDAPVASETTTSAPPQEAATATA
jgi:thioredoxin-dependent peroxiredoxin